MAAAEEEEKGALGLPTFESKQASRAGDSILKQKCSNRPICVIPKILDEAVAGWLLFPNISSSVVVAAAARFIV